MSGRTSVTSIGVVNVNGTFFQATTAEQSTDWYGTVRGRAGWLATPNLLLFGTGAFAYGRVDGSATYLIPGTTAVTFPFSLGCAGTCAGAVFYGKFIRNQDRLDRRRRG
jgi:hypothetical protein